MPGQSAVRTRRIALAGNPNTGKTTVFNMLTGFRARTGNYAGVTVERKAGGLKGAPEDQPVEIVDLPGTYSLSARSADEMVAADVLLGLREDEERPDLVLIVADASNLERNLFLATQVMECGVPCVLLLNMMDVAKENRLAIDATGLSDRLRVPVFPIVAAKGEGLDAVRDYLVRGSFEEAHSALVEFPEVFENAVTDLLRTIRESDCPETFARPFLARRALLETDGIAGKRLLDCGGEAVSTALSQSRKAIEESGQRIVSLEARVRYGFIKQALRDVVERPEERVETLSDRIDRILIHRVWGTLVFVTLMIIVFQAIYSWSAPFMDVIDGVFGFLGGRLAAVVSEGPLQSFLVDGVIAGVGGVVIFLPQILCLFLFISLLEDCGYMARAAFLMDRLLSRVGLSGRSFIPMLSSFACAIPGVMATRTIEDRRDRFTTMLIAPLMSCSARLPVYTLLIGAFIPERKVVGFIGLQGLTLFAMYLVGVVVAIPVALILKKTFFKGSTPALILELPPYRRPGIKVVIWRLWERAGAFLKRAGTIIFAVSIIVWAAAYYPRSASVREEIEQEYLFELAEAGPDELPAVEERMEREIEGAYLRQSILGRMGHVVEPLVRPLGWDWKIGMATIASFPAREVIVATLGIIYDVGSDADEESPDLREKLQNARHPDGTPVFTIPVALSIMVFFALCAQCAATLAVIKRETNSWRWPFFSFAYMTLLAWIGALLVYQISAAILS